MTAAQLLADCQARDIVLTAAGDRLNVDAPKAELTPELVAKLQAHKPELLDLLKLGDSPAVETCPRCGSVRIAAGLTLRVCIDCEMIIGPVGDVQDDFAREDHDDVEWIDLQSQGDMAVVVRSDASDLEIIDLPPPCPECGGIAFWWDVLGNGHCERCKPRTEGDRLRKLAQELREGTERQGRSP
jgi:hypothetical protein